MSKFNLNDIKKVKYICEYIGDRRYHYRQEYLLDNIAWGSPRPISEKTFIKRKKDGFPVEYRHKNKQPNHIICTKIDLYTMIDEALRLNDKQWFMELTDKLNKL